MTTEQPSPDVAGIVEDLGEAAAWLVDDFPTRPFVGGKISGFDDRHLGRVADKITIAASALTALSSENKVLREERDHFRAAFTKRGVLIESDPFPLWMQIVASFDGLAVRAESAEARDPTEGLPGKLMEIVTDCANGRPINGGDLELITGAALALESAEARVKALEAERRTAEAMRDVYREIAIKLGACPKCAGLHGDGPCLPPVPSGPPPHKMMG